MSRFYVTPDLVKGNSIYVTQEESHHIVDVMRLGVGDTVTVFDGTGMEYKGVISKASGKNTVIDVISKTKRGVKKNARACLAQAVPKKDTMDFIVQKATELGVDEIFPMSTARTIVKPSKEKAAKMLARWRKDAIEASKQCSRPVLPEIHGLTAFEDILELIPRYDISLIPCLSDDADNLKSALGKCKAHPKNILTLIGPEGDFTKDEVAKAINKGAIPVSLGALVLRCDTAALTVLSVLNFSYE